MIKSQQTKDKADNQKKISQENMQYLLEKREEWLLDLQGFFDKIYQALEEQCLYKQMIFSQNVKLNKTERQKLKESMKKTMEDTENLINSIRELGQDEFFRLSENQLIEHEYKRSMSYLLELMKHLYKMENDSDNLENIQIFKQDTKKREVRNRNLNQEITQSSRRLQRTKAGIRLDKVIEEQLEKKNLDINTEKNELLQQKNDLKDQKNAVEQQNAKEQQNAGKILDEMIDDDENDNNNNILTNLIKKENSQVREVVNKFNEKKQQIENLILSLSKNDSMKVEFKQKYLHIYQYFKERYNLVTMYLGEKVISEFIRNSEKQQQVTLEKNEDHKLLEEDRFKELDPYMVEHMEHNDKNVTVLNKIVQINEKIKENILREEHEKRLEQIKELSRQQNQKFWDNLMKNAKKSSTQNYLWKRPNQDKNAKTLTQSQLQSVQQQQQQGHYQSQHQITKKYNFEGKNNFYMSAHPNNQIITKFYDYENHQNENYELQNSQLHQQKREEESLLRQTITTPDNKQLVSSYKIKLKPEYKTSEDLRSQKRKTNQNRENNQPNSFSVHQKNNIKQQFLTDRECKDNFKQIYQENFYFKNLQNSDKVIYPKNLLLNQQPQQFNNNSDANTNADGGRDQTSRNSSNAQIYQQSLNQANFWLKTEQKLQLQQQQIIQAQHQSSQNTATSDMDKPLYMGKFSKYRYKLKQNQQQLQSLEKQDQQQTQNTKRSTASQSKQLSTMTPEIFSTQTNIYSKQEADNVFSGNFKYLSQEFPPQYHQADLLQKVNGWVWYNKL